MKKAAILCSLGLVLALAMQASAVTVTLYASADAGLASDQVTSGSGKYGYMNADLTNSRRSVIQWDLSSLGAITINSAQMQVYRFSLTDNCDGKAFAAYRVDTAWTEGGGMSNGGFVDGTPDGVNWTYAKMEGPDGIHLLDPLDSNDPTAWTTPGGDISMRTAFTGVAVADPLNGGVVFGWMPDITTIAQSWLTGGNYGVAVLSEETVYQRHAMRTRDYGYPDDGLTHEPAGAYAPRLVLDYTPVPEPASMSVLALGALALLRKRSR